MWTDKMSLGKIVKIWIQLELWKISKKYLCLLLFLQFFFLLSSPVDINDHPIYTRESYANLKFLFIPGEVWSTEICDAFASLSYLLRHLLKKLFHLIINIYIYIYIYDPEVKLITISYLCCSINNFYVPSRSLIHLVLRYFICLSAEKMFFFFQINL